MVIFDAVYKMT